MALALEVTEERARTEALRSDDLEILGNYLFNKVGSVSMVQYARNPELRSRVDEALQKVADFVGREGHSHGAETAIEELAPIPQPADTDVSEDLRLAQQEAAQGNVWNALAGLRRHIEITLRKRLKDVDNPPPSSISLQIRRARELQILSTLASDGLLYAVQVCNAAVHGYDVSPEQADAAIQSAAAGLSELERKP